DKIHEELAEKNDDNFYHGYTYSGHPTAAAIALKNLDIIKCEKLLKNVRNRGRQLIGGFQWLQKEHDVIKEIRGIGLLGAVEFAKTTNSKPIGEKVYQESLNRE